LNVSPSCSASSPTVASRSIPVGVITTGVSGRVMPMLPNRRSTSSASSMSIQVWARRECSANDRKLIASGE
jgi:hypothetical protein